MKEMSKKCSSDQRNNFLKKSYFSLTDCSLLVDSWLTEIVSPIRNLQALLKMSLFSSHIKKSFYLGFSSSTFGITYFWTLSELPAHSISRLVRVWVTIEVYLIFYKELGSLSIFDGIFI